MRATRPSTAAILAIVAMVSLPASVRAACDPSYVSAQGSVVTVIPTGADDTANLQCAIDLAGSMGIESTVQLSAGTYQTHQLVVRGLNGSIRGAGRDVTTIQNGITPMHIVNPVTWVDTLPSAENPYPTLISIIGDHVVLADLSVHIVGPNPTDGWFFMGSGPFRFVVPALAVVGSNITFRGERIEIAGSDKCFPDPEANLLTAFEFWNFASHVTPRVTGTSVVMDEVRIKGCGGMFVDEIDSSQFTVTKGEFANQKVGVTVGGLTNSQIEIAQSRFGITSPGIQVTQGNFGTGILDSSLVFRNNQFSGQIGIRARLIVGPPGTELFRGDVACAMVGNNVEQAAVGYWLGVSTYGCAIVGHGNGTVIDETNGLNQIVGVTPVPGGVGGIIGPLMRK